MIQASKRWLFFRTAGTGSGGDPTLEILLKNTGDIPPHTAKRKNRKTGKVNLEKLIAAIHHSGIEEFNEMDS